MRLRKTPRVLAPLLASVAAAAISAPAIASAHFFLEEPENWREQGTLGDPQKTGPCGDEGTAAMTGAVTAYRTGQTITIRFRETIFHPGHFRVSLATTDRSELPAVPPVTPGATDCGSVPIMDPPVFPVLGDGLLPHTSPLSGVQTMEVTLPDGVTCDHCTLQVVQFMSSHGAPCFYCHCADLSISDVVVEDAGPSSEDASVATVDAATSTMTDAASTTETDSGTTVRADAGPSSTGGGCACAVGDTSGARGALVISALVLGAVVRRRRRR